MSGSQIPASAVTETPSGFICAAPWQSVDRALYIDVNAYLASVRMNRNVLSARVGMRSANNIVTDQTFILTRSDKHRADAYYEVAAKAGNVSTVLASNRPVHVVLKRESGELDMGEQTLLIVTSPIVSLKVTNRQTDGDAEINLIMV